MAIAAYPFDGQTTTESQYSELFKELQDSGVAGSPGSSSFLVSADGSGLNVKVQPGFALVRGHAVLSTAVETLSVPSNSGAARVDRVVLRLDPGANSIVPAVVPGTSGSATPPTLVQTTYGVFEAPLGLINVGAGVGSISSTSVKDDRQWLGSRVRAWTTATRPNAPRTAQLGLNTTTSTWEFWTGTGWSDLAPSISWSSIGGRPTTFTPAPHEHSGADVTSGTVPFARLPIGTGSSQVAAGNHKHVVADITDLPVLANPNQIRTNGLPVYNGDGQLTANGPSAEGHVVNKAYADNLGESGYAISTIMRRDGGGRAHVNGPTTATHVANKGYVDAVVGSGGQADGPTSSAYGRSATGSGLYAVWMNSSLQFMRNTSSRRYKENITAADLDTEDVLAIQAVEYDRIGGEREFGLIAEQVAETLPEIVTYFHEEGEDEPRIDGVRYDLLSVALLQVAQRERAARVAQDKAIASLLARIESLEERL